MKSIQKKSAPKFGRREAIWSSLLAEQSGEHASWDMLVIGGGITGAGVLREASKRGLKVLLIDQRDFSWGTSSRSSKMVHGGLRYLTQGDFKLTHEAVNERQRMLDEAPGLVEPMKYLFPFRKGQKPHKILFNTALKMYDLFAGRPDYQTFDKEAVLSFMPNLSDEGLYGGTQYTDAVTDDSRLVMRVLHEAIADGATVLNYVKAKRTLKHEGKVTGAELENQRTGEICQIKAKVVVSATGAWADMLRGEFVDEKRIRPLRGSHVVVPSWRLSVHQALTFQHPNDGRFTFIYPWEGTTVIGTTDLDHTDNLDLEAGITQAEVDYILAGANNQFPHAHLTAEDVLTTWSGVRPIVAEKGVDASQMNPSDARRSHSVWNNQGLITVTGGKLTTFRTMALEVLNEVKSVFSDNPNYKKDVDKRVFTPITQPLEGVPHLGCEQKERLQGFYGVHAQALIDYAEDGELTYVPGSLTLWAEIRWLCANEAIEHLDDLMLRRTRLGLTVYKGGLELMPKIRNIVQQELDWDDARWEDELSRYTHIWQTKYSLPQ